MALIEEMEKQGNFLFRYRGILPIIILLSGLALFAFTEWKAVKAGNPELVLDRFDQILAFSICIFGFAVRIYTVGHTPRNTSGRNTKAQIADELNTNGVYSLVRHPLYFGNFFMWLGVSVLTMNLWFILGFVLIFWIYYERIMFAEEQYLRRKFGETYLEWARKIPAFFPSFRNWKPNNMPFNWRKVIVKEKTGFLAIFVVIFVFDLVEDSIKSRFLTFDLDFWLMAMIFSLSIYLVIKLLQKNIPFLRREA